MYPDTLDSWRNPLYYVSLYLRLCPPLVYPGTLTSWIHTNLYVFRLYQLIVYPGSLDTHPWLYYEPLCFRLYPSIVYTGTLTSWRHPALYYEPPCYPITLVSWWHTQDYTMNLYVSDYTHKWCTLVTWLPGYTSRIKLWYLCFRLYPPMVYSSTMASWRHTRNAFFFPDIKWTCTLWGPCLHFWKGNDNKKKTYKDKSTLRANWLIFAYPTLMSQSNNCKWSFHFRLVLQSAWTGITKSGLIWEMSPVTAASLALKPVDRTEPPLSPPGSDSLTVQRHLDSSLHKDSLGQSLVSDHTVPITTSGECSVGPTNCNLPQALIHFNFLFWTKRAK